MADLDEDDAILAQFIEDEILSSAPEQQEREETTTKPSKRPRVEEDLEDSLQRSSGRVVKDASMPPATGIFSVIPPELFCYVFKFLSPEDLVSCSMVCKSMNFAASDEGLWRRLYAMRWGLASRAGKVRACAWKELYFQRDQEELIEFVNNTPDEFKEYFIHMQTAKRSQAPLPSKVSDDRLILDKTIADQVSMWKISRGLSEDDVSGHICSGNTCSYSQIGDVFLCDKTGRVHVCDDNCRERIVDTSSRTLVCTISGQCIDTFLTYDEKDDEDPQANHGADDTEFFMGSGHFERAFILSYNCVDDEEEELEAALRFC